MHVRGFAVGEVARNVIVEENVSDAVEEVFTDIIVCMGIVWVRASGNLMFHLFVSKRERKKT